MVNTHTHTHTIREMDKRENNKRIQEITNAFGCEIRKAKLMAEERKRERKKERKKERKCNETQLFWHLQHLGFIFGNNKKWLLLIKR